MSLCVDCMKNVIVRWLYEECHCMLTVWRMSLSFSFLHLGLCIGLGCDMVTAVATGLRACVPIVLLHFRCIKVMEAVWRMPRRRVLIIRPSVIFVRKKWPTTACWGLSLAAPFQVTRSAMTGVGDDKPSVQYWTCWTTLFVCVLSADEWRSSPEFSQYLSELYAFSLDRLSELADV